MFSNLNIIELTYQKSSWPKLEIVCLTHDFPINPKKYTLKLKCCLKVFSVVLKLTKIWIELVQILLLDHRLNAQVLSGGIFDTTLTERFDAKRKIFDDRDGWRNPEKTHWCPIYGRKCGESFQNQAWTPAFSGSLE